MKHPLNDIIYQVDDNDFIKYISYHKGNRVAKVLCVWLLLAGALNPLNIGFLLTIWRCLAASGPRWDKYKKIPWI